MSSSESDIDEVRAHEWKPGESSTCVSDDENTNDKTKQVGLKLVQNDKPSPVKKPKKCPGFLKNGLEQKERRSGI
jgi:hypothetical protein